MDKVSVMSLSTWFLIREDSFMVSLRRASRIQENRKMKGFGIRSIVEKGDRLGNPRSNGFKMGRLLIVRVRGEASLLVNLALLVPKVCASTTWFTRVGWTASA